MGSKKHKKHKYERRDRPVEAFVERGAEPLRLVLKVGGSSASEHGDSPHIQPHPDVFQEDRNYRLIGEKHKKSKKKKKKKSSDREKRHRHHHHHHEKKEKRKRERSEEFTQDESEATLDREDSQEPPAKQALYEEDNAADQRNNLPFREPRACTLKNRQGKSGLQRLLDHLLKNLELKDPQQFFAWPVTDHIAPGYSSIIAQPMDFSTLRSKIENNDYETIHNFMGDVKLMCDNAMTYNRPDTIYYKSAKRMLHVAVKQTSKDKLLGLKSTLPFMNEVSSDELGFEHDEYQEPRSVLSDGPLQDENSPVTDQEKYKKSFVKEIEYDGMTADEILAQARKAAKGASDKLTLRRPNSKFGFLRQHSDGSTSLSILNPSNVYDQEESKENVKEERKVTLEMLVGKLTHGTGTIAGFKEDKRNIVKPVNYLNYGNFGSYAPTYDSIFANVTKEESDLIYSTYGDETCVQYAESLYNFAKDCDFACELADSLLDSLTDGEHGKLMKQLDLKKKTAESDSLKDGNESSDKIQQSLELDYNSLKTLSDEGIDMSFLDTIAKQIKKDPIQKKLDETSTLLHDLAKVQNDRLSAKPPPHLSQLEGPSVEEREIAEKLTTSLTELSKKALPGDLANVVAVRKAIGISGDVPFPETASAVVVASDPSVIILGEREVNSMDAPPLLTRAETHLGIQSHVLPPELHVEIDHKTSNCQMSGSDQATDLEIQLREFLETGPTLRVSDSPNVCGSEPTLDDLT